MEHLIPLSFFEARSTVTLLLLLAAGIVIIAKGADLLVESAVRLSCRLGIPKIIIGATIVSLGTTTPEAAVSVMAAINGMPDFALGNAVGSIICDTALIFGLCCAISRLPADRFVLNRHGWIQFGAGMLLVVMSLVFRAEDGVTRILPRSVGLLFLGLLGVYLAMSVVWGRKHSLALAAMTCVDDGAAAASVEVGTPFTDMLWLTIGVTLIILASHDLTSTTQVLCLRWGVPASVVSATIIAFGTSLPELVTAITSLYKGHKELIIGNIIGADILNVLFVTGAAATAMPLKVESNILTVQYPFMIAALLIFRAVSMRARGTFPRWPGFVLMALYVAFIVFNYLGVGVPAAP